MTKAYIKAISYYLPETIISNEDIVRDFPDWTAEKIERKLGIRSRRIAGENETSLDLAVEASQKLFNEHKITPESIDFVLLCTQSPEYFLPTTACILQKRLNLPTSAGALDFNLGCSGFVYGLSLAKGLIAAGIAKNVLMVTSETYSKIIHELDRGNRTLFGDAAAATLISFEGDIEIQDFVLGTDGEGAENLILRSGGFRYPNKLNDFVLNEDGNPESSDHLFMSGTEIFNFTLEKVPLLVRDTLAKNDLELDDIDLFVFHQANKYMLDFLRQKIDVPKERFYYFLENVGNTVSSTIPIALYEAKNESLLKGNVLLSGFGVGYSWAGTILKC